MCTCHYVVHVEYVFYWSVELFFTLKDNLGKIKPEMFSGLLIHTYPHTHAHAHMIVLEYTHTHTHKLEISLFSDGKRCLDSSQAVRAVHLSQSQCSMLIDLIDPIIQGIFINQE